MSKVIRLSEKNIERLEEFRDIRIKQLAGTVTEEFEVEWWSELDLNDLLERCIIERLVRARHDLEVGNTY